MIGSLPKLALPKPADWGFGMTVCIAGIADEGKAIITIADRKVALPTISADDAMEKIDPIHHNWGAMVAGMDITHAIPIWDRIRELLGYEQRSGKRAEEQTLSMITGTCTKAFQEHRRQILSDIYLSSYGIDMQTFLTDGRRLFGATVFAQMCNQISTHEMQCEFLVAGFDEKGAPHIFTVDDPGVARVYDSVSFWAIGSGQQLALSSLMFGGYLGVDWDLDIYDLCAAKFMAEKEPHVGVSTFLIAHRFNVVPCYLIDEDISKIKCEWEMAGKPRRPSGIDQFVKKLHLIPISEDPPGEKITDT